MIWKGDVNRRSFLKTVGAGVVALGSAAWSGSALGAESEVAEIEIISNYASGLWYFEPAGLYIKPGQKVRWVARKWGATATAFHPDNNNHELRIPLKAKPFDSKLLGNDRFSTFEWTFDVEGTYDYFSSNHEVLGMVGRIVVGTPGGPAGNPPGYGAREGRVPLFRDEIRLLEALKPEEIVQKKTISYPKGLFQRKYPC